MSSRPSPRRLAETFEPGYRVSFNMAPPVLARRDPATGHRRKRSFGPWLLPLLKLVARGKVLRGTVFDLFGYQEERRVERSLIRRYEEGVRRVLVSLDRSNHDAAVRWASLPDGIRGFGHVKRASIEEVRALEATLLAEVEQGGARKQAA